MKSTASKFVLLSLFLASSTVLAKPTKFFRGGLSYDWFVTLDVSGKTAQGTYRQFDNRGGNQDPGPDIPFSGKVIPTPKGKKGVYLEIKFSGETPYDIKPKTAPLVWHLRIVDHRAHLFIPMVLRNFDTVPAKFEMMDLELEPSDD